MHFQTQDISIILFEKMLKRGPRYEVLKIIEIENCLAYINQFVASNYYKNFKFMKLFPIKDAQVDVFFIIDFMRHDASIACRFKHIKKIVFK